jgi:hypothetical protein
MRDSPGPLPIESRATPDGSLAFIAEPDHCRGHHVTAERVKTGMAAAVMSIAQPASASEAERNARTTPQPKTPNSQLSSDTSHYG